MTFTFGKLQQLVTVPQKLVALVLCTAVPLIVTTGLYLDKTKQEQDFSEKERVGVKYAQAVWPVIVNHAIPFDAISQRQTRKSLSFLEDASAMHDPTLRLGSVSNPLMDELRAMSQAQSVDSGARERVVKKAEGLLLEVGDASNLILDPELDSFYLMDLVINRLPNLVSAIEDFTSVIHQAASDPSDEAEIQLVVALGRTNQAFASIESAAERAIKANKSPELAAELASQLEQFIFAEEAFNATANQIVRQLDFHDATSADLRRSLKSIDQVAINARRLLATTDQTWRIAAAQLDGLLETRLTELESARAAGLALSGLALALAALLAWAVTRSIVNPQRELTNKMKDLANGDSRILVPYREYRNELGEVARAVEVFRAAIVEREMLELSLEQERDELEDRVLMRTAELDKARFAIESEKQTLDLALQAAGAGVWLLDGQNQSFWCSPRAIEILGEAIQAEHFEDGVWRCVHPEDRELARDLQHRALTHGKSEGEVRHVHPDGKVVWVRSSMSVRGLNITGLVLDITEQKNQEQALSAAREQAEAANTAKSEFLATMSHEIRTPMNGVIGMASALARTPLRSDQREMLKVISESSDMLLTILNDVLDLVKIESGRFTLEEIPFDLGESMEAVLSLYRESTSQKGLVLVLDAPDAHSGIFKGDPVRVRQIVQNFTSNALKFSSEGSVTLRVRRTENGVRIEVADTGIGLNEEQKARMFKRFEQADNTITRRYGGTGLGLSICKNLAELMGGAVGVESISGEGSCFWLEAPLAYIGPAVPEQEMDESEASVSVELRILAADDNAINRLVLKTLFEQIELEIDLVENGALAVQAASIKQYDLILMDVHMPEMDGMAATRAIRQLGNANAAIPIIALTADALPEHVARCLAAGMTALVAKPIKPDALFAAISAALDGGQSEEIDEEGQTATA